MKRSFTLIEILGVVALIAILGTIGFAGYSYAMNRGKESATQSMIARLGAALESAREREGYLPDCSSFQTITIDLANQKFSVGNKVFANAESNNKDGDATLSGSDKKRMVRFYKDFMKAIQGDSLGRHLNGSNQVIDGWGEVIYYRYPGIFNRSGFDLISAGSDGKFGKENASTPSSVIGDYREDGEMVCDDIGNF